jgi:hypothetical protein
MQPYDFACAMQAHWTENLGNVSSSALMSLWTVMAQTFNSAVELSDSPDTSARSQWRILQPPTGSGKTQGIRIYSAMTAARNYHREINGTSNPLDTRGSNVPFLRGEDRETEQRVGILIVTRETEEADKLAAQINDSFASMTTRPQVVAIARHSRNRVPVETMRRADVLVITHQAYVHALDRLLQFDADKWSTLVDWEGGRRKLTVIDETISNLIESYQLNLETLKQVKGFISEHLRRRFPQQMVALDTMEDVLRRLQNSRLERSEARAVMGLPEDTASDAVVWGIDNRWKMDAIAGLEAYYDMSGLRTALLALEGTASVTSRGRKGVTELTSIAKLADDVLKSAEAVFSRWAYFAHNGSNGETLNTSKLIFPADLPAPVVLDATASQDVLWHLLGADKVHLVDIPKGARSYANMTLHVAFADGLGKRKMIELRKGRVARLLDYLNARFAGQSRKVLMVSHKDVEPEARAHKTTFGPLATAHWGAIDGKNHWHECDTAVILGMPFRDAIWANNLFLAINDHNGKSPELGLLQRQSEATYRELEQRQLTVSIVQALNRIRCRRVTDAEGNCPKAEAFILLPSRDGLGERILDAIKGEMPEVVVKDWAFAVDAHEASIREGSSHQRLLEFMKAMKPGEMTLQHLRDTLGLASRGVKEVQVALRNAAHPLTKALAEIGVSYSVIGAGRGAKAMLVKRVA